MRRTAVSLLAAILWLMAADYACAQPQEVVWFDGTRATPPAGQLLSDNDGFWGPRLWTGVEYNYEQAPDNPPDRWRDKPDTFGRRLLDGRPAWNWWTPVGRNGPLVVVFDFQRSYRFREVDLDTRNKRVAIKIEARHKAEAPWQPLYQRSWEECPERQFHRLILPQPGRGRYLRLTVEAKGITWLEEVLVWGEAEEEATAPGIAPPPAYMPLQGIPAAAQIHAQSLPEAQSTAFSDATFWEWQRALGPRAKAPAVWASADTWGPISHKPLLPAPNEILREARLTMARNEIEQLALILTNTNWENPWTTTLRLTPFTTASGRLASGLRSTLRVAGTMRSRQYGVTIGPLFAADNKLSAALMERYLTNGYGIKDFPRLTLARAGAAVLWLSVTTEGARPGRYRAVLEAAGGPSLPIIVDVLDVTLPRQRVWLQTWSSITEQFPYTSALRTQNEIAYKRSLGVTVWNGFPEPGSIPAQAWEKGRSFFHIWGIGDYGHRLYGGQIDPEKLTEDDAAKIAELIRGHVAKARQLGLDYDDWYVELTDEPGKGNAAAFGALCRLIRKADPHVRIYCNPSFWVGTGCLGDEEVFASLSPWYNDCVDISCPIYLLLYERPRAWTLFHAPRLVRAFYDVCSQSAKSESPSAIQRYRKMAWQAFSYGWNGWGFYSYYAPRGNPWDDFDADWYTGENMPDYQLVFPGPNGPIPTRPAEAVREGWEDYCLLTLLKQKGKTRVLQELLAAFAAGEPVAALRERALQAAAR